MDVKITFNVQEIETILNILGEQPVKSNCGIIFNVLKERAEAYLKEAKAPEADENNSEPV